MPRCNFQSSREVTGQGIGTSGDTAIHVTGGCRVHSSLFVDQAAMLLSVHAPGLRLLDYTNVAPFIVLRRAILHMLVLAVATCTQFDYITQITAARVLVTVANH